jgi:hypothetical protein
MVSEPSSICWQLGLGGQAFLYWMLTLTRGPVTIFLNETCFPELLEPIKQLLKIIKYEQFVLGHSVFE